MRTISVLAVFVIACGPPKGSGGGGGGGDDSPDVDASTDPLVDADFTPVDMGTCGAQMQNIGVVNLGDPPDLLVVLDRSGSMSSPPSVFPPTFTTKFSVLASPCCSQSGSDCRWIV